MRDGSEGKTTNDGPLVIDAGAWTGAYEPTPEEVAAADRAREEYVRSTREIAQSPRHAILTLIVFASMTIFIPLVIVVLADAAFVAIVGVPLWAYIQKEAEPEIAGWLNLGALAIYTLLFLAAIYSCRGIFRNWLLPVWHGGFSGTPCLFVTDDGFLDTRMLRDIVYWENIDDSEDAGITYVAGRGDGKSDTVIKLRQPVGTRGRIGGGTTKVLFIHGMPFGRSDLPYDFLTAHYQVWKKRHEERRRSDAGA